MFHVKHIFALKDMFFTEKFWRDRSAKIISREIAATKVLATNPFSSFSDEIA